MTHAKRPVLIAPDKFRGTLSAAEVAAAIARGLARAEIATDICGIADGGEGTIEVLRAAGIGAEPQTVAVSDALGRQTSGRILMLDAATALVQSADAIGLQQLAEAERDAVAASSHGAGELIAAAAERGVRHVLVGIGGTASSDGGAGAVELLRQRGLVGVRGPLRRCPKITALCDVRAAYEQAVPLFAPQKGASVDEVVLLGERLGRLAEELPKDPRGRLMTGAGGGLAGGLWAACGAELKSGAAWLLAQLDFDARMLAARAVVTGEGSLDRQSLLGKAVGEVATRARQAGVPCHAIVGQMAISAFDARILDLESVAEAGDAVAIADAAEQLADLLAAY
jgi:glycerate kinase